MESSRMITIDMVSFFRWCTIIKARQANVKGMIHGKVQIVCVGNMFQILLGKESSIFIFHSFNDDSESGSDNEII